MEQALQTPATTPPQAAQSSADTSTQLYGESRFVEVLGSRMHYVESGEGDPILFIHGQPTWSYLWRNVMPYVDGRGRTIAVDLIGMGRSDKPAIDYRYADHFRYLEGFIEALGLRNLTLVVHDWGSVLGLDYAMRHESNVRGVAFMEALIPPAFPKSSLDAMPEGARELFAGFRDPELGRKLLVDQNVFVEQLLPGMILRTLADEEMDAYREPFLDPASREPVYRWPNELPIGGQPQDLDTLIRTIGVWLAETDLPKLHVYAAPGAVNPPEIAELLAEHLDNTESAFVGPGLHYLQEDQPEAVGRAIADWLRRLEG